ncbi:MAG: hypothetical protein U0931_34605 [Vulcanimicrobiota bacterium]
MLTLIWCGGDSASAFLLRSLLWLIFWAALALRLRRRWLLPLALMIWVVPALMGPGRADSSSRQAMLYHTKLRQIERGRLSYLSGWGWVDRRHRLLDVWQELQAPGPLEVTHLFFGYPGWGGRQAYQIRLRGAFPERLQKLRVLQLLGQRCEWEEASLPWWTGAPASAYNADDLSSVYFTLFELSNPDRRFTFDSAEASRRRWKAEGPAYVQASLHSWRDLHPAGYEREFQALMTRLEGVRIQADWAVEGPLTLKQ